MKALDYGTYFDKVYGCFLGKCVGGTAGGPAEGRKELMDAPLNEDLLHQALPNDDLDLQILWLELLESRGLGITAREMAKEFYEKVPYGPGEYGFFKKNYGRGIYPPLSGVYNNRYYQNGMGCPIRSEIWACLFPGSVKAAVPFIRKDGSLDHLHNSVETEIFLAAMEAEAFFCGDFEEIFARAMDGVEKGSKLERVLSETHALYHEGKDWKFTRASILKHYGHSDCTNMYQNLGFILLALLYGGGDFRETVRIGLACGYDTDCICASAASVLGAMEGAEKLLNEDGLSDTGLKIEVKTRRRAGSIRDLASDVCRAGLSAMEDAAAKGLTDVRIVSLPDGILPSLPPSPEPEPFSAEAVYDGDPVLRPDRPASLTLKIVSRLPHDARVMVTVTPPDGVSVSLNAADASDALTAPNAIPGENTVEADLAANGTAEIRMTAALRPGEAVLNEKNLFGVRIAEIGGNAAFEDPRGFGLAGCAVWYRYGPFLMNNKDLSAVPPHVGYGAYFPLDEGENGYDVTRDFHLSNFADPDREFVDESEPFCEIPNDGRAESVPEPFIPSEDLFDTAELDGFEGPHTDYLVRYWISPEERDLELAVGHTAPFKLWLNGAKIGEDRTCAWWTAENRHFTVHVKKGENVLILKCSQVSDSAKYSVIPRKLRGRWQQWEDFGSALK